MDWIQNGGLQKIEDSGDSSWRLLCLSLGQASDDDDDQRNWTATWKQTKILINYVNLFNYILYQIVCCWHFSKWCCLLSNDCDDKMRIANSMQDNGYNANIIQPRTHYVYLYPEAASSTASCRNSSYILWLKCWRRKNDQNRNNVFISADWPMPNRQRSVQCQFTLMTTIHSCNTAWDQL